jgi:hypothetical protein
MNNAQTWGKTKKKVNRICKIIIIKEAALEIRVEAKKRVKRITEAEAHPRKTQGLVKTK